MPLTENRCVWTFRYYSFSTYKYYKSECGVTFPEFHFCYVKDRFFYCPKCGKLINYRKESDIDKRKDEHA